MKGKKWVLAKHFDGVPKDTDLELQEEEIPALKKGEVLFKAVYLSVDPYMRPFSTTLPLNSLMIGEQVAEVKASEHPDYSVSGLYLAKFGWRTHTVLNMNDKAGSEVTPLPDMRGLCPSLALGVLGMPGVTAYVGLLDVCSLKSGDVVLVNAGAGAVGSVVRQIAKIKGCKVIAFVGTPEKVEWLKKDTDHVFNYKECNISDAITSVAPDGIDVFYDNVGGQFASTVITKHMKMFGRVAIIGGISGYNIAEPATGPLPYSSILFHRLRIQGIIISDYPPEKWEEAKTNLTNWVHEGKLKYREHVTTGFDKMPSAFFGLFKGENKGKAIVKV